MATRLSERLPGDPAAPSLARAKVDAALADVLDPETSSTARLLVSELVTNAVLHGSGRSTGVLLEAAVEDDVLHIEVGDEGDGFGETPPPVPGEPGRLGLVLVQRMAERWGTIRNGGWRVWFELQLDRDPVMN